MKKFFVPIAFLLAVIMCVAVPITVTAQITSFDFEESSVATSGVADSTSAVEPATETKIIPSDVTCLKVSSIGTDSLVLSWKKSRNADLYTIYRAAELKNGKIGSYEKYKDVKETSFKDTNLDQARIYRYQVFAYRVTDEYVTQSKSALVSAMTKPKNISAVKIYDKKTSSMTVSWKKSVKADKYVIYRSAEKADGSFEKYEKIREIEKGKKLRFTDKKLKSGTIYKYKVAVKRVEGDLSAESSGTAQKGMTILSAPSDLKKLKASETAIKLGWNKVNHADKYEVFRDGKKIKTVKATTYTDRKLLSGASHKYTVIAIRKVGKNLKTGKSRSISASCKLPENRVEVSISKQMLYLYKNNKVVLKSPVVTGVPDDRATSIGNHHIISKKSPAILRGSYGSSRWNTRVNYWLGFTYSGQGFHDSTWRSGGYGGNIYRSNGSHGCVNTPIDAMKKLYDKAYIGMLVIVKK
ncbi:MAG: L,D-transpeptidase family protein [Ruminococcus sp.]|nr:L,D-transpeptidase family protein [Ruminococcus sp.]